jgi:hypothetical protein
MIKNTIASTLFGLGIAQMTFLPAQTDTIEESTYSPCCAEIVPGEPLDPCLVSAGYPYPATITPSCGWNIYAKGDFLYLAATSEALNTPFGNLSLDGTDLTWFPQTISYRPGFRVFLGMDLGSVVLDLSYLRYHSHNTSNFRARSGGGITAGEAPPDFFTELFLGFTAFFQNVRSTWHLDFDVGSISLQKPVYMGKRLIMSLNYGLLGVWSGSKWNFRYTPLQAPLPPGGVTSDGFALADAKSWAIGPNLGFAAAALLPMHFKAIATIDLALQYGYTTKMTQVNSFPAIPRPFITGQSIDSQKAACLQAYHMGEIGLGWGDYFGCDRFHVDLSVTYNFFYQHIYDFGFAQGPTFVQGMFLNSYTVHGIAVGGRLDF